MYNILRIIKRLKIKYYILLKKIELTECFVTMGHFLKMHYGNLNFTQKCCYI